MKKLFIKIKELLSVLIKRKVFYEFWHVHILKRVSCVNGGKLNIYRGANLIIDKTSKLIISGKLKLFKDTTFQIINHSSTIIAGVLNVGPKHQLDGKGYTTVSVIDNSTLKTNGGCIFSGATIISCRGGNLNLNGYFHISIGCLIRSQYKINIYDKIFIGRGTIITDTDSHSIIKNNLPTPNKKEVNIFDNVWIGMNCTILKGVTIEKNCMIAAGTLIANKRIPEKSVVLNEKSLVLKNIDGWNL